MTLPSPAQMDELSGLIVEHGKTIKNKWYSYKGMKASLDRSAGDILMKVASTGAQAVLTAAAGVATGMAFISFGAVLTPWIAAADVVRRSGDIFELHDLKDHAAGKDMAGLKYHCHCGKCAENIKYVVDKKERNVARIAVGVATVGVSAFFNSIYSIGKSFQSGRPKETVSKGLVDSSRKGCTTAIATVFLLSGDWQMLRGGNAGIMRRALAIITAEDGWKELKSAW